jgi:hypothetical protein
MPDSRKAAIDIDKVLDSPLNKLSAVDLLKALGHPKVSGVGISLLPDKKKYEVWVEEVDLVRVSLREILEKVRGEKKKLEHETPDLFGERIQVGPREFDYTRLVEDIAARVEERLRRS